MDMIFDFLFNHQDEKESKSLKPTNLQSCLFIKPFSDSSLDISKVISYIFLRWSYDELRFGVLHSRRISHSYGVVTITDEGLQILIRTRHSWPLSSKGSIVCHTYCYTGHPFIILWPSHLLPSVWQWSCHYIYLRLRSVTAGIRTPNLLYARQML